MNRREVLEQLLSALVETGADFSVADGAITVGGLSFKCREDYIVVAWGRVTNFFQYETLAYIRPQGDSVSIADSHVGVFGTYKVRQTTQMDELEDIRLSASF